MEKRTKKMLLAILMIITLLATDFFVLGSGIMTYATELSSETNNTQVEFSAYFKDGENRVDSIEKSIKAEDVKLYAEITVKNEGYLKEGAVIEIENSNFNLKNEILPSNTHINSIEGNKVNLKQINNGETIEIELGIEPIIAEKIKADFLTQTSTVKMLGTYVYSKAEDGTSIATEKQVCINYVPDETTGVELETEIITNKIFAVSGANKRIIQLLIKSKITNNEYPVKQTTLKTTIPELGEEATEITAIATGKLATSGISKIHRMTTENGVAEITLNNEPNENNEIKWNKNIYDEIVVTYIYPETVDASKIEITTDLTTQLHNSNKTYTETQTKTIENEERNSVIFGKTEIVEQELYKGNLYANLNTTYETKSTVVVTNANVADKIVTVEGPDVFGTEDKELQANTRYVSTEINLAEMLEVIGNDGNIEIKNGETVTTINKDTETDENGNIVINYENGTSGLEITINNPANAGIIELKHTKEIKENNYTRAQLQQVKTLNAKITTSGTLEETEIVKRPTETATLELKETTSKVELTIENNKQTLSTIQENEVTLGITLITNGTQYDLYKNPKMSIKFPSSVENVELLSTPNKQNADEFTINVGAFDTTHKTLQVELQGEQTSYPKSELTQSYIQLNLKVTLNQFALAQADTIMMAYTNENAVQYEGGRTDGGLIKQEVQISAPSQLIKMFNLSSNANTSLTETILQQVKQNEAGKTLNFGISLINNEDSDISNLKILGKLPTTNNTISGQNENTLETILKGITAENGEIYYTENTSTTEDVENTTNGWTTDLSTLTNAKMYLIKVNALERGANYVANLEVQIPNSMAENAISYTQYEVIYDTATETEVRDTSRKIGLATSMAATIKTEIKAQVGQDILENGDVVKEGEVIKYTVTVHNEGPNTLENVQLKLDVPEGTTYVRPISEEKDEEGYYEEITDVERLANLTTITIPQLTTNVYTLEYEVRVNKGTANKEISNKSTVIYNETEVDCTELKNIIQNADIRVSIENVDNDWEKVYSPGTAWYIVNVENLSNSTINNLEIELITNEFDIEKDNEEKITISEINANEMISVKINGMVRQNTTELNTSAIVKDSNGNTYRSNYVKDELLKLNMSINMTSPQNGQYIKEGDTVEYNITVKSTCEDSIDATIEMDVPQILEIQSIALDGNIIKQSINENDDITYWKTISNTINEDIILELGKKADIKIVARVLFVPDSYHGQIITSNATITSYEMLRDTSEMVTHVLKANDENIENVLSGMVWFDENENGQRDGNEERLSDIEVKIYDYSTQDYLQDTKGKTVQTITDVNGEYTFSNIKDGLYLIIFEYDTEKYALTTSYAQNVDSSINSKATIKTVNNETYLTRFAAIETGNLTENAFAMNMGLKEKTTEISKEEQPGIEEIPIEPENPTAPENPEQPETPTEPENPTTPENPDNPTQTIDTKKVSGFVWLDSNKNGKKDDGETYLSGIKVRLYNVSEKYYTTDEYGKIIEIITDANGSYEFSDIEKGSYIVIFEYDTEEYEISIQNLNIVSKKIKIDGKEITVAVTDTINVQNDVSNINIGLKEKLKFDLELNKYISKIVVQTSKETKTYNYDGKTLGKVEIHRKQIQGANVVLEYTIKIKNTGEIAGYAKNIVDYLPSGLTFSSELNTDWYLSGSNLHTKSLENIVINPGEENDVKLILTKKMTNENVGLINNRAEIYQDYNKNGEADIDSTPNNQAQDEDDFGTTDVIIQVATGGSAITYTILVIINIVLIYVAIRIMIANEIIEIKTKEERR